MQYELSYFLPGLRSIILKNSEIRGRLCDKSDWFESVSYADTERYIEWICVVCWYGYLVSFSVIHDSDIKRLARLEAGRIIVRKSEEIYSFLPFDCECLYEINDIMNVYLAQSHFISVHAWNGHRKKGSAVLEHFLFLRFRQKKFGKKLITLNTI